MTDTDRIVESARDKLKLLRKESEIVKTKIECVAILRKAGAPLPEEYVPYLEATILMGLEWLDNNLAQVEAIFEGFQKYAKEKTDDAARTTTTN